MGTHNVTLTPHKFWSILLCPFLFCPRLALLFCQSAHICNVAQPCEQLSRPDIRIIQNLFWSCKVITLWAAQKDCVPASVISIWKHNIIHRLAFCSSTFPTCSQLEVFFFLYDSPLLCHGWQLQNSNTLMQEVACSGSNCTCWIQTRNAGAYLLTAPVAHRHSVTLITQALYTPDSSRWLFYMFFFFQRICLLIEPAPHLHKDEV